MSEKKIAVVTGGARGIGKAIALELAKAGNLVVINYNGSEEKARETKAEIEAAGGQADILQCNVADFDACEAFFKAVAEKYGRVDILVNNAGVTKDGLLMKMSEEDFDRVLDTNLKGAFHTIRHASRYFLKQKSGKIINISSVWSNVGASCEVAYSACKGGMNSFTRGLAKELAPSNIQVNAIACGCIDPQMNRCFLKKNVPPLPMRSHPDDLVHRKKWLPLLYLSLKEMNTLPDRSSHWMESGSDRILLLKQRSSSFLSKGCFSVFTILHV